MDTCNICADKYTKQLRKEIKCQYCDFKCCLMCIKGYILTQTGIHCMGCKKEWSVDFQYSIIPKTWISKKWYDYLAEILFGIEKARLKDSQEEAERIMNEKKIRKMEYDYWFESRSYENRIKIIEKNIKNEVEKFYTNDICTGEELHAYKIIYPVNDKDRWNLDMTLEKKETLKKLPKSDIKKELYRKGNQRIKEIHYRIFMGKVTVPEKMINSKYINKMRDNIKELREKIREIRNKRWDKAQEMREEFKIEKKERKEFEKKCPKNGCNGMLSSSWKCRICETWVCNKCEEIKKEKNDESHVCDKNTIESLKLIKKDTKGCPKCSCLIHKTDGCDQMWCTQCKVAFSWRTGEIVTRGVIHNPHYLEFMRKTGSLDRDLQDEECGGLPSYYEVSRRGNNYILNMYRRVGEIDDIVESMNREINELSDNNKIRVNWILGYYNNDDQIKKLLRTRRKREDYLIEEIKIWDMIRRVMKEGIRENNEKMIREIQDYGNKELERFCKERSKRIKVVGEFMIF